LKWQNYADILNLTVTEACKVFTDEAPVLRLLQVLRDIGLGYLRLGQAAYYLQPKFISI